jgi:ABC-type sugar transport system permease subunit
MSSVARARHGRAQRLVYQQAFKVAQIGAAAAMGTVLIIIIVVANLLITRAARGST